LRHHHRLGYQIFAHECEARQKYFGGETAEWVPDSTGLQVIYAPGHCKGQMALFSPENDGILVTADIAEHTGELKLVTRYHNLHTCLVSIKRISMMDFKVALFSHGRPVLFDASDYFRSAFGFD